MLLLVLAIFLTTMALILALGTIGSHFGIDWMVRVTNVFMTSVLILCALAGVSLLWFGALATL